MQLLFSAFHARRALLKGSIEILLDNFIFGRECIWIDFKVY